MEVEVSVREGVNEQHVENSSSNQVKTGTTQHLPIRLELAISVREVVLLLILIKNLQDLINAYR